MSLANDIEHDAYAFYDDDDFNDFELYELYLKGQLKWRSKNGKSILIKDMEEIHIRNILRLDFVKYSSWELILKFELSNVRKK